MFQLSGFCYKHISYVLAEARNRFEVYGAWVLDFPGLALGVLRRFGV